MTSRERVRKTIKHIEPDRIPIDLGSSLATGIHASSYAKLKKALGVGKGDIKVIDTLPMLAEVEDEVKKLLGVDTYAIQLPTTTFGYRNENWKPFKLFDGTDVLVPGNFTYDVLPNGDIVQYPEGNRNYPPSGKMPKGGYYFDSIIRQEPIEENKLDPKEWAEQSFDLYKDEDLKFIEETSKWYFDNSEYSLIGNFWGADFGDIAFVPGSHILEPKGIRDVEEWYVSFITRKQYIKDIFQYQYEIQMENLKMYREAAGDRIDIIIMSGTDFGTQNGPLISPDVYREIFKPLHKAMNDWVHENTEWKTLFHTCGSVVEFLDDFIEAGVDILNPVQITASGMYPEFLKENYGDKLVFCGGGIDTQRVLPFGTTDEVKNDVENNIKTFGKNGGFIVAAIHNIQANVPAKNIIEAFKTVREKGHY
jgi:hypothetical protein